MRTTIRIDDDLYRRAKALAAREGRPVADLIADAVRAAVDGQADTEEQDLPPLPTFGGGGTLPGVDLAANAALRDVMDADEAVDALR